MFGLRSSRRCWFRVIGGALASLFAKGRRSEDIPAESWDNAHRSPDRLVYVYDGRNPFAQGTGSVITFMYDCSDKRLSSGHSACHVVTFTYDLRGSARPHTRPQHPTA